MTKVGQLYPEIEEYLIPLISLKTKILENFEFVFLKEDIHRFISSTELFLSDIRGLRYIGLKKVNFFVGHPVCVKCKVSCASFMCQMPCVRCQVSCVKYHVSSVICQVSCGKTHVSNVLCQVSCAMCQMLCLRCHGPCVKFHV